MSDSGNGGMVALVVIVLAVLGFIVWLIMSGRIPMSNNAPTKNIDIKVDLPTVPVPTPAPAQ